MPETLEEVLDMARPYADNEHRALNIVIAWWLKEIELWTLVPFEGTADA